MTLRQSPLRVRVLRSGSSGNAILVEAGPTRFLIDAGLTAEAVLREIGQDGQAPCLDAILLTHEHDDHASGAAAVGRATGAVVLANEPTLRAAGSLLAGVRVELFKPGRTFALGSVEVTPFPLPHDAAEPVGFVLCVDGVRAAIATDLGEVTDELLTRARGADLFVLEANYDLGLMAVSSYPWFLKNRIVSAKGHLSNDGAARAAVAALNGRPQTICLVHLSEANNLAPLARDTVRAALDAAGARGVRVEAVRPNSAGPWWTAPPAPGNP